MIQIISVGKVDAAYFRKAIEEYLKRLSLFTKINIIELKEYKLKSNSEKDIQNTIIQEGQAILEKLKGFVIALDRKGQEYDSEGLAELIENLLVKGTPDITFVIGGSYGLSEQVLKCADRIISFGRITYPHQLMRVILVEQIYRAFSIINNSKYHK